MLANSSARPVPASRPLPGEFFCCDWGTSSFRLRRVRAGDCAVLAEIAEPAGVKQIHSQATGLDPASRSRAFATFLADRLVRLIQPVDRARGAVTAPARIVVSGMASSTISWQELPYARLPVAVDGRSIPVRELALDLARLTPHPRNCESSRSPSKLAFPVRVRTSRSVPMLPTLADGVARIRDDPAERK